MEPAPRLRSAALLPSLVTLGNLACGVGAILWASEASLKGNEVLVRHAAWLLVLAMIFDAVDGKLARMTRATSDLGAQLDSLADMVAFGVAPAVLVRTLVQLQGPELGIRMHPRLLVVTPLIFACCAALRLARFNVEAADQDPAKDHPHFVGLPSPAAAGLPIAMILFFSGVADPTFLFPLDLWTVHAVQGVILRLFPFVLVLLGTLMVTRLPFPHVVAWLSRARHPFQRIAEVVLIAGLMLIEPELALLLLSIAFLLIPPARNLIHSFRAHVLGRHPAR